MAVSEWLDITQDRIGRFAEATDDHQWIHVDPARAAVESPLGTTIAHGFLTLSLLAPLVMGAITVTGAVLAVNYGLNRVRFVSPVPAGSRIRARFRPEAVSDIPGGLRVTWAVTVERAGAEKPACVAEWVVHYKYEAASGIGR